MLQVKNKTISLQTILYHKSGGNMKNRRTEWMSACLHCPSSVSCVSGQCSVLTWALREVMVSSSSCRSSTGIRPLILSSYSWRTTVTWWDRRQAEQIVSVNLHKHRMNTCVSSAQIRKHLHARSSHMCDHLSAFLISNDFLDWHS